MLDPTSSQGLMHSDDTNLLPGIVASNSSGFRPWPPDARPNLLPGSDAKRRCLSSSLASPRLIPQGSPWPQDARPYLLPGSWQSGDASPPPWHRRAFTRGL